MARDMGDEGRRLSAVARAAAPFVGLCLAVSAAFAPGLAGDLLRWDDDRLVYENPLVGPPYLEHTVEMFRTIRNEAYQPLHVASYQIDRALWNLDPLGCHLFNLALYALGVCLLFVFVRRLAAAGGSGGSGSLAAFLGTLAFALHPVHVESVAWVSGRKDVLSLVFVALALLAHARSARPLDRWGAASAAAFLLAGLAKTTSLFVPLLLPFVDRWGFRRPWRLGIRRAAPTAAISTALGVLVLWIWHSEGLVRTLAAGGSRIALAPKVLLHYASSVVLPFGLSPLYPIDRAGAFDGRSAAGLVLLAGLAALAFVARRSAPLVALGVVTFLLGLLPVLNLVPMTFQANDRYLLLPTLGIAMAVCGYAGALAERRRARLALLAGCAVVAAALGALSFSYSFAWRDDLSLWRRATSAQPSSYYAWMKLGETLRDAGRFREADDAYATAIDLEPDLVPARGGRMLSCLAAADRAAGRSRPMPTGLAAAFAASWGDAAGMLEAGSAMFADGYDDCAFEAIMDATRVRPALPDGVIAALAREWLAAGRPGYARALLGRVTPAGRSAAAWREVDAALRGRDDAP